jgi:hypothetical protein
LILTSSVPFSTHTKSVSSPSAERLYDLGWNDTSCFFGDPETYVTAPRGARERKLIRAVMTSMRGFSSQPTLMQAEKDEGMDPEDLDAFSINETILGADEDMFLPQHIAVPIQSIPYLLRGGHGTESQGKIGCTSLVRLEQTQAEYLAKAAKLMRCIIPDQLQPKVSCRGFGASETESLLLEDTIDPRLVLDYLPTLRRMAVLERAAEEAYKESTSDQALAATRRKTRSSTKASRWHYFDCLSQPLKHDSAELDTSQVGSSLADGLLKYGR